MPKANTGVDDHAKVKVRVIEFELEGSNATVENSIRQLTTALTPRNGTVKALPPKPANKELSGAATEIEEVIDAEVVEEETSEPSGDTPQPKKTPKVKAKPKAPTYLHDLMDPAKLAEFKAFAAAKNPTTRPKQYLTATYWLKEHGGNPTVNADKIYTCFKTADWPTNFNDWRAPFDRLVHEEDMRKTGVGEFAINPTGEAKVK
jgi:hypothetical protein